MLCSPACELDSRLVKNSISRFPALTPNRFSEILASPQNVELSLIANAVSEIDTVALQDELISFASSYKDPKKGLLENMNDNENDSDSLESEVEYTEIAESSA